MNDYLSNRHQRVVLNGVQSAWLPLNSGVPQGSVLGPLLFLIYINDLTVNISSQIKLFADDASLFLPVRDTAMCQQVLKKDLDTITKWAYQWKMKFNPDITKQAVEVIFSHKRNKPDHPSKLTLTFKESRRTINRSRIRYKYHQERKNTTEIRYKLYIKRKKKNSQRRICENQSTKNYKEEETSNKRQEKKNLQYIFHARTRRKTIIYTKVLV